MKKSPQNFIAIGLMSGTSMDGIDLAMIESDGKEFIRHLASDYMPYESEFKAKIRNLVYGTPTLVEIKRLENEITMLHGNLVNNFLAKQGISSNEIDLIGFHGQTIFHAPNEKITWQLGNGALLAHETKISVVADFRTRDVVMGGQGAPLVPVYHRALFSNYLEISKKNAKENKIDNFQNEETKLTNFNQENRAGIVVLNIGGISNLTYFDQKPDSLCAFDCAFGNAPLDDLMHKKLGRDFDDGGKIAASGKPDLVLIEQVLQHKIFHQKPPKSYHRSDFDEVLSVFEKLEIADHLASLTLVFAKIIRLNFKFLLPSKPSNLLVCGGGRKNIGLMKALQNEMPEIKVQTTDDIGLNGDLIEAEAFAYLAILRFLGLPSSFTGTTAVKSADGDCVGGVIYPFKFK